MILLALLLQLSASSPAAPPAVAVRAGNAEKMVPVAQTNLGPALQVDALAPVIPVQIANAQRGHFRVTLAGLEIVARDQLPFVTIDGQVHQLASAPYVAGGRLHLPFHLVSEVLPRLAPDRLRYDERRAELRLLVPAAVVAGAPSGGSSTAAASAPGRAPAPLRHGLSRQYKVVVDAGHGGGQPGMTATLGPGRTVREKEITLAVSLEVERMLKQRGVEVIMIRRTDVDIDFRERGRIANQAGGDLFVSVHVNAANPRWRNAASVRGFETYFLAEARTEDERRVAAMENAAVGFEAAAEYDANDPLGFLMRDMVQNAHLRESSELAEIIQRHLAKSHPGPNRGVKQAPFAVLVGAYMPAVLVEIGFGSNPVEARYMHGEAGRRQIAIAITDAVMDYLERYDRRLGRRAQ